MLCGKIYGLFALWCSTAVASPTINVPLAATTIPLPHRVITQFEAADIWIENLAVRPNGNLLLTSFLPNASLYEVLRPDSSSPTRLRHFTIKSITSLLGIAEVSPDNYVFVGGNVSLATGGVEGTWGLWSVDFNAQSPSPKLVTQLPHAFLLNGVIIAPQKNNLVLISDSSLNLVWRVDLATRKVDIAAQFQDNTIPPVGLVVGINGIKIRDGFLWWTNRTEITNPSTGKPETDMYRIQVDQNGSPVHNAKAEKVVEFASPALDDFVYGPGNRDLKWVTTNVGNVVYAVGATGQKVIVGGSANSTDFATATACQFGRTRRDSNILYVTTGGVSGVEGGKVQAIDTTGFSL
ncbi:Putative hetero-Diels-Alderase [Cladobotryum mycophilum]|uniref:Hetero-Diels-Alderase n=1 Tax=Cladobotryum mycophilum TaxID=491253 RepID=A0ABR0SHG1_9HYPO